jgi:hypothetical protein
MSCTTTRYARGITSRRASRTARELMLTADRNSPQKHEVPSSDHSATAEAAPWRRSQALHRPDPLHRTQRHTASPSPLPARSSASPRWVAHSASVRHGPSHPGREGRGPGFLVFSRSKPATPSRLNPSCQSHAQSSRPRRVACQHNRKPKPFVWTADPHPHHRNDQS